MVCVLCGVCVVYVLCVCVVCVCCVCVVCACVVCVTGFWSESSQAGDLDKIEASTARSGVNIQDGNEQVRSVSDERCHSEGTIKDMFPISGHQEQG